MAFYEYGDRNLTRLVEVFTGLSDTDYPTDVTENPQLIPPRRNYDNIVYQRREKNIANIQEIQSNVRVQYKWQDGDNPNTITLKSNSSKPNVATKYTWEVTGWDWDADPRGWSRITAWSPSNEQGDVRFEQPTAELSSPLRVVEDSSTGSEVTISLHSKHLNVGIKLTIEPKDGQPSTLHIPAFISTG